MSDPTQTQTQKPNPPPDSQVSFRLLCHVHTAGGVIGNSGSIIKHLETQTGSRIRFEEAHPNCTERVVNVSGDSAVDRRVSVSGGWGEEGADVAISRAQEGLVRVFERVLEVEFGGADVEGGGGGGGRVRNGFVGCRLLAPTSLVGAVMGKGGKVVDGIRRSSGAKIRVLKKEHLPACAAPDEELIQIQGGTVAVKKALCAISRRLQDRSLGEGSPRHVSSHGAAQNSHADTVPRNSPKSFSLPGNADEHHSDIHSLSADVDRTLSLDENSSHRKVVFRYLCSNAIAGGVIGKGANIVKSLEKETGASIKFTSQVSGSKERVAIISSLENPDPLYSPAQIATVRVFARCVEVGVDQGLISSLEYGESVTARILVASSQVFCLLDEGGKVAPDISVASSVEIRLMGAELPNCAGDDDNVVQITGEYENVKSALFQVTGKLRESLFSSVGPKETEYKPHSYSALPSSSPNSIETDSISQITQLSRLSYIDQLDHLGFVEKPNSPCSPGSPWEQAKSGRSQDCTQALGAFPRGLKHESNFENEISKQTVEVAVHSEVFFLVYGEENSNLARLKEISGATIILQDPCPGERSGKVIISGTPERIQIAQSLLQAFISF